ncbi:glycosylated lysosomal membrane protein [Brienomyrus brachyistius]|uniref:glycosylated lysosomal membrane protein n=1 Tax=Brienomyrus brachyistius TaxID=42636 RepID=UPI0020B1A1D6|nr:glycosylated lysosomal membrane protein [Brienomyrus brachyistius]
MAVAVSLLLSLCVWPFLTRPASAFIGRGDTYHRKVSLELNPGLNSSHTAPLGVINLLHVRATGNNDTLHFIFCSQGAPAVLLVHTDSSSSSLKVDWPKFLSGNLSGSLKIEPEHTVHYSSALVFTRLWEYDDGNDTADPTHLPPSSFFPPYELQNFTWVDLNGTLNYTTHTAQLCGKGPTESFHNGSFCLGFSAFESEGRDPAWPCLLHNANASQVRFWLKGVTGRSNFSRFVLELQHVDSKELSSQVETLRSIDDEYTPSIFQVSQWVSRPLNSTSPILGYVQWKPVAYRTETPVLNDATPCRHSQLMPTDQLPASDLILAYFGDGYNAHRLNVTFSIAGDPFYNATNYLSWTVLVGLGSPPIESFSALVIGIMALGLGIPLVLILLGGVFVCVRKQRPVPQGYEPIN